MANGRVDDLSWAQLRPRVSLPKHVTDSIPPEDMQSFLLLVAKNPLLPFADASAMFSKIVSLRQWRTNTTTKQLDKTRGSLSRQNVAKRRRDEEAPSTEQSADGTPEVESDDEQPKRKQRRSSRPTLNSDADLEAMSRNASRGVPPKIGAEFQAQVAPHAMARSKWLSDEPKATSQLVFSAELCKGESNVSQFVSSVNQALRRRDGFPLAPFALELCLQLLGSHRGDRTRAMQEAMVRIPRGAFFPGIKGHFEYEEQCLFVSALAERSKNFSAIARHVLKNRSCSELVWLYYTRHKQLWLQNGGMKQGLVLDDGGEKLKRVQVNPERIISALRCLAITAGDGFPVDSRVAMAAAACRRGQLVEERRRRDEEQYGGRRVTRQKY